jgi:hypothetical protein
VTSNISVVANFGPLPPPQYTLTINTLGNGSTTPSVGTHTYGENAVVPITATSASGWQFDSWTGGVNGPSDQASNSVTMDADKTITAIFTPEGTVAGLVSLTIQINGNGTTSPEAGEIYNIIGTVIDITAIPEVGWKFINWTGDVVSSNSDSTTVTMDADKTITANFKAKGGLNPLAIILAAIVGGGGFFFLFFKRRKRKKKQKGVTQ